MTSRFPILRVLLLALSGCSAAPIKADVTEHLYGDADAQGCHVMKDGKQLIYWGLVGGWNHPGTLLPQEFAEIRRVSLEVFFARRHGEERFTRYLATYKVPPPGAAWDSYIASVREDGPTPYNAIETFPIPASLQGRFAEFHAGVILPDDKAGRVTWAPGTAIEVFDDKGLPGKRIDNVIEPPTALANDCSLLVLQTAAGKRWQEMDGAGNPKGELLRRNPTSVLLARATIAGRSFEQWSVLDKAQVGHRLHQLVEANTEAVLREWHSVTNGFVKGAEYVHLVPGVAVFVLDAQETERCYSRYGGLADEVVAQQREQLGVEAFHHKYGEWNQEKAIDKFRKLLANHRRSPAAAGLLPQWRSLDLDTRQLRDTDIVWVERIAETPDVVAFELTRRLPDEAAGATRIGRLDAEMVAPTGDLIGHYEHVHFPIVRTGAFHVVTTYRPDHTFDEHVLGPCLQYLATAPQPMTRVNNRYLAIPAPGTTPDANLWAFLQPNGQFGTPPGVAGFRPVWTGWQPKTPWNGKAAFFLVRYTPGADHEWGRAEADLTTMTGPIWDVAELYLPPTVNRAFAFEGILHEEGFAGRKVHTDDNDAIEDNAVLVVRTGDLWSATTTVANAPSHASLHAEGKSLQEVLERTFALAETHFAARQDEVKAAHPALVAKHDQRQRELDAEEASRLRFAIERDQDAQRYYSSAPDAMAAAQQRIDRAKARLHVVAPEPVAVVVTREQRLQSLAQFKFPYSLAMLNETFPNPTAAEWFGVALYSNDLDLLEQATFYHKVTDPGQRSKLLAHWRDVVCQEDSEQGMLRAMDRLRYAGQSFSASEQSDVMNALRDHANDVRNRATMRQEAARAEAHNAYSAQRWAEQRSWPGVSGASPPAAQTNWAMNDYKRGLDRQIAGKAWTPYGY